SLRELFAVAALRFGKAGRRAILDLDALLPGQAVAAIDQVVHVGIGRILGAAIHGSEAAMGELVDIILDAPVGPRLAHQVRADLGGDDLVGAAGDALGDDRAV